MVTSSLSLNRDFNALMTWLKTFPRMEGHCDECSNMDAVLKDETFATAILYIADEICDATASWECSKKDAECTWRALYHLLSSKMPHLVQLTRTERNITSDTQVLLLSALLCYGVSDNCKQQRTYIERILSLSKEDQKVLMGIVEKGKEETSDSSTPSRPQRNKNSSTNLGGSAKRILQTPRKETLTLPGGALVSSPQESQFLPAVAGPEDRFTSPSVDSYVDNMIVDLREQNKLLKQELDSTQQREVELGKQIESSQDKLRKEMIKLDSTLLRRVEDVRDEYERQIFSLKEEVSSLREANEKLEQREVDSALVRKEELELAQARLAATEKKLELCKERVKETSDIKKALLREEEAHSASVEECHRLENELKSMQTLKNKLEKQKERAVEAESELAEREEDLVKLFSSTQEVEDSNKKLTRELSECKEEAEDLRRQLAQKEQSTELCASESSDTESSVQITRLRHENMQLRNFLAEVEQQNQCELTSSEEQVAQLECQVDELNNTVRALRAEVEERTSQLMDSQASLSQTCTQLRATETKYETLCIDSEKWKRRADDAKLFTSRRRQLLSKLQTDMANALNDDEETIEALKLEVNEWKRMASRTEGALEKYQSEYEQTKEAMHQFAHSLDDALAREETLKEENEKLGSTIRDLQSDLGEERRLKGKALAATDRALQDKCHAMMGEALLTETNSSSPLMELLAKEREVHETQFDLLKNKYQQHLSEIKKETAESEARMEDKHLRHVAAIMEVAHEEHEKLVEDYNDLLRSMKEVEPNRAIDREPEIETHIIERHVSEKAILEERIASYKEQLSELSEKNKELSNTVEQTVRAEIDSYKKQAEEDAQRAEDMAKLNASLMETVREMKIQHDSLQSDNDELQKQMDEKLLALKKVQRQFETLESEFSTLLNESRDLRKDNAKISSFQNCVVYALTGSTEALTPGTYTSGFVGTTKAHLRKEYELKVKSIVDEKRNLLVRSNSAATDMQKALQQAWEADQQVAKLKKELRSAKLARQDLQNALQSSGIDLNPIWSASLGDSSGSSSNDSKERQPQVQRAVEASPLDNVLLISSGSNDTEAIPALGSSSSSSMDIPPPPPPPPPPPSKAQNLSAKPPKSSREEATVLAPPSNYLAGTTGSAEGKAQRLSVLLKKLSIEEENSSSTPKTLVGGQHGSILSPSSKHNRRVHWNEDKLWSANDGSTPLTPLSVASPINDKYSAVMMSPSEQQGSAPFALSPKHCTANVPWKNFRE